MLLLHSSRVKNISTSLSVTQTDFAGHLNVLLPPVQWLMWSISDYTVFSFLSGAEIGLALWLVTEELLAFPEMTHLSPCWYIWNDFELCGALVINLASPWKGFQQWLLVTFLFCKSLTCGDEKLRGKGNFFGFPYCRISQITPNGLQPEKDQMYVVKAQDKAWKAECFCCVTWFWYDQGCWPFCASLVSSVPSAQGGHSSLCYSSWVTDAKTTFSSQSFWLPRKCWVGLSALWSSEGLLGVVCGLREGSWGTQVLCCRSAPQAWISAGRCVCGWGGASQPCWGCDCSECWHWLCIPAALEGGNHIPHGEDSVLNLFLAVHGRVGAGKGSVPVRDQRLLLLPWIYGMCPTMGAGVKIWEVW